VISDIEIQSLPRPFASCNLPISRSYESLHLTVPSSSFC
jgi:hypothetical protein